MIEGFPIAMSPAPPPKHQWIAANFVTELTIAIRESDCKNCRVYIPIDFKISDDTVLQPDISIVCGDVTKKFLDFPPVLVVEILSPSTALRDRHTKFKIYEQQRVSYFLLVNTDNESIEIYSLINGSYVIVPYDPHSPFTFQFEDGCSIEVMLHEIWT